MKRTRTVRPTPPAFVPLVQVDDVVLLPGDEVTIAREPGRFTFKGAAITSGGRLTCDFVGGPAGHQCWRSFYADRITKVLTHQQ